MLEQPNTIQANNSPWDIFVFLLSIKYRNKFQIFSLFFESRKLDLDFRLFPTCEIRFKLKFVLPSSFKGRVGHWTDISLLHDLLRVSYSILCPYYSYFYNSNDHRSSLKPICFTIQRIVYLYYKTDSCWTLQITTPHIIITLSMPPFSSKMHS